MAQKRNSAEKKSSTAPKKTARRTPASPAVAKPTGITPVAPTSEPAGSSEDRGTASVKKVFAKMEETSRRVAAQPTAPAPMASAPTTATADPVPAGARSHGAQEIDLKPYQEVVSYQARLIWQVRGGDDVENWLLAERLVREALACGTSG
ncbi:MAG: hypothetical protein KF817_15795 [Phycisphaeraceae bacterium]|nr:hypothetical protein [Phycisphaeraceae bacterium]